MMYIERIIVRKLAEALLNSVADLDDKESCTITVDSDRGYDPDAKTFNPNYDGKSIDALVEDIVKECDEYDEVHIFVGGNRTEGYGPWVYLIFGNGNCGWDVITDYSTSLEEVIKPVMDFVLSEGEKG